MKNNKSYKRAGQFLLAAGAVLLVAHNSILWAAPQGSPAPFSVDATEIEYNLQSGDGTATGKTTIKQDGGIAVAQGGATFNSKSRTGHLYGGVTADKEDQHLRSNELVLYTEHFVSAVGDAHLTKGDKTLSAPRVDYHEDKKYAETLGGSARLSATDGSWLTASKITYDMQSGIANATGGVNLENKAQNTTGYGDRAVYDSRSTGYVELIGNAKATRDGNTITGNKLRITNTSASNTQTHASGNVRIVYYPRKDKKTDGSPAAQPAGKEGKEAIVAQGKGNTKAKTAVTAAGRDTVFQAEGAKA